MGGGRLVAPQLTTTKLVIAGTPNATTRIIGTPPGYLEVFAYQMWTGNFLNQASVDHNLRVAVLGSTTADNLGLTETAVASTPYLRRPPSAS